MKVHLKEKAIKLRLDKELGYSSIAKILSVPKSTLSTWLKDYPLSEKRIKELRRQNIKNNDAKIESFRNTMRLIRENKFQISYVKYLDQFSELSKESKFVAGLMLYLAEGSKKDDYHIAVTNTDPGVIRFFMEWLSEFFDVSKSSVKFQLQLYPNMNIPGEINFWRRELKVDKKQFYKYYLRKLHKASFTYRDTSRHGICGAVFSSSEIKREIMAAIKAFVDRYLMRV